MATHGMTIAKASKDDFEKVYNLLSPMEELFNSKWCNEEVFLDFTMRLWKCYDSKQNRKE